MIFFLKTILLFITPLTVISITFFSSLIILNNQLEENILDPSITSKIKSLYNPLNPPDIIAAGDSRAERQIIPFILEEELGKKTINIATSSMDILTTFFAIKKFNMEKNKKPFTFLISAGIFQANDGVNDRGYLSTKTFQQLDFYEKMSIYKSNFSEFLRLSTKIIKTATQGEKVSNYHKNILERKGFLAVQGEFSPQELPRVWNIKTTKHAWYKGDNLKGYRWKLLQETFLKLSKMKHINFIIYLAPVSPSWEKSIKGSYVEKLELQYSQQIQREASLYSNIKILDFYQSPIPDLKDHHFYDPLHLNEEGALIFTKIISSVLKKAI